MHPPNWWEGMQNSDLQIMLHAEGIAAFRHISADEVFGFQGFETTENVNYIFLNFNLIQAKAGDYRILLKNDQGDSIVVDFPILQRKRDPRDIIGFSKKDAIYLITPDRFASGNPDNDVVNELRETIVDRSMDYSRHGGDLKGIINHLDYIDSLGITALWLNPVLENDMPRWSYHGYAITDYYKVDPRYGNLNDYVQLAEKARERGIKLIMDMVANHCGVHHWWMQDLPSKDWINNDGVFAPTNHRRTTIQDPYALERDRHSMTHGWFVPNMPDLNHKNPLLANYIIQNSIWWVETLGLGGIRQDTYPYCDYNFMSDWAAAIMHEYPNFNIVGEEWSYNPLLINYWQHNPKDSTRKQTYLNSTMDFALQRAITEGLSEEESWDKGLIKIYECLANDFHYNNPESLLSFPDNHDMDRIFTQLNEDVPKTKMALAIHCFVPRILQLYYGTEILMQNSDKPGDHGLIRSDFPGGWPGDTVSAFNGLNLNDQQGEFQEFTRKLLNLRKDEFVMTNGRFLHKAPEDGMYICGRKSSSALMLLLLNKSSQMQELNLMSIEEMLPKEYLYITDLIQNGAAQIAGHINVGPNSLKILKFH
jgi:glycosidase